MPTSIKKLSAEFRCPNCDKLLATPAGIKCPRCKTVHSYENCFAHELRPDQYYFLGLWRPDGRCSSSIIIRKEIWVNVDKREGVPPDCTQYPVFFVYNAFDPSQACGPDAGCRVNREPILDFQQALNLAKEQEIIVRASGKWVDVKDVKVM